MLPRSLDVIFNSISKKLYTRPNLKPKHCQEVISLTKEEEDAEELLRKATLSACEKEVSHNSMRLSDNFYKNLNQK